MNKSRQKKYVIFSIWLPRFIFLSILSGCSLSERLQRNDVAVQEAKDSIDQTKKRFERSIRSAQERSRSQHVSKPWLVGRAVPLARELTLPAALQKKVDTTLMYRAGKADLQTFAERITQASGIPVRIKPEALLPSEQFMPRFNSASTQTPGGVAVEGFVPIGLRSLPEILDVLSRRFNVLWRYNNRALEFYRTETQVFDVRALTLSVRTDAALGRTVSGKSGGFDNSSRTSLVGIDQNVLMTVKARLEPFLTRAAIVAAQPGASTSIVVTDIPEVLAEISQYLERENRVLNRRVRLTFEEITLVTHEDTEFGLDWDLVWEQGKLAASLSSSLAGAAVSDASAKLGLMSSPLSRSQVLVRALSKYGTVLRHTTVPVMTLNRRPVTHAVRTTFSYIDQIKSSQSVDQGTAGGRGGIGSVSISQKEETVGSFLTLVPDAQEDGQVLLSIAYDSTVAQPLKSVVVGEASSRLQIQQITINGHGTVQQVALKSGQPMLISGFDSQQDESDQSRLSPDAPVLLGGSNRAKRASTATIMMVTAQVEEGI
jgi:type IVB pilus formation R64 PilN family outer membrane protein